MRMIGGLNVSRELCDETNSVKWMIAEGEGLTVEFKERFTPRILEDMVAFANGRGGRILLGVSDDGKLKGEKLTNALKSQIVSMARNCDPAISVSVKPSDSVVVIDVREGNDKPYACSAGYFQRLDAVTQKMTQKEIRAIFRQTVDKLFEDLPREDCRLDDISIKKIKAFLAESGTAFNITKRNLPAFLTSVGVFKEGKINNAGVLMFAAKIERLICYSEVICGAFKGTDRSYIYDRKDVRADLLTQLNAAIEFIKKQINIRSEIRGINRYDIYELPLDALREAVVNAIVHRDYSMRGTSIYVAVYDDRVEIENPGGFPSGVTKENFGKTSIRRNLILADLFHRMGKVERIGSGIRKMKRLMKEAGLKPPVFEADTFFRATFYRDPEHAMKKVGEKVGERVGEKVTENQRKILDEIGRNAYASAKDLSLAVGISPRKIEVNLQKLKQKKLLKRIGPDKGGYWKVIA